MTLPNPQILKLSKSNVDMTKIYKEDVTKSLLGETKNREPVKIAQDRKSDMISVSVQTVQNSGKTGQKKIKAIQTDELKELNEEKIVVTNLRKELENKNEELHEAMKLQQKRNEEISILNTDKMNTESTILGLRNSNHQKDKMINKLHNTLEGLRKQIDNYKQAQVTEKVKMNDLVNEENISLLNALSTFESDKNAIVEEYKELLNKERNQYAKSTKELQMKILDLESQLLDRYDKCAINILMWTLNVRLKNS